MPGNVELALFAALIGVTLLLNPLYLYPGGGGVEHTYEVDRIDDEAAADRALTESEDVLVCPGERACQLETSVLERGAVEADGQIWRHSRYVVVGLESSWYRTATEQREGTTVLALEPVDALAAVEHAAVSATARSSAVAEAVDRGTVTVLDREVESFRRGEIVERSGEHYDASDVTQSSTVLGDRELGVARLALFLFGGAALLVAGALLRADAARSASETEQ